MAGGKVVTIGDIARVVGVSRSTASYALSGKRSISEAVRRRVAEAARELGYTPNAGAKALATAQTMVVGLLARFHPDEFAPAMLQYILGVTDTARELGYDTLLVTEMDGARALRRISASRMVDGIVLLNVAQDDDRLPVLREAPQPGVLVGLPADSAHGQGGDSGARDGAFRGGRGNCTGVDVFDLDFEGAGRLMVDHLHELGHRELILVSQPEHVVERGGAYVWRLRDAACERAQQCGMRLHTVFGESAQPEIGRTLNTLLDTHPAATGLLLNNEAAAVALPSVLAARGLRVPGDLSVIGRYSDEFARMFALPFSSIESAPDRLGRLAVRQLVRRIAAPARPEEPFVVELLPPELADRGSTGHAAR